MKRKSPEGVLITIAVALCGLVAVWLLFAFYVDDPLREAQHDASKAARESQQIMDELMQQRAKLKNR